MINTRLVAKEISSLSDGTEVFLELQDFLEQSIYMKKINQLGYYYLHVDKIYAGLEVAGREENLYHHDSYIILDFNAEDLQTGEISFQDYPDLISNITALNWNKDNRWLRLEFNPDHYKKMRYTIFSNKEK